MQEINEKKAAFIVCVNDEKIFAESLFYLDRLILPQGFEKDVISIQDAPSMAAGYHAGMKSTDAKYKIYMHQDVSIINPNFLSDIIRVFEQDAAIGMLGCIGTTDLGREAMAITSWNTGKVIHNAVPMLMEFDGMEDAYTEVMALDGLLMATQYDVPWRKDIMDGWDFYDISQCMEFARAGYKVVVPKQDHAWCYHDNTSSNMTNYNLYRKRFVDEYAKDGNFQLQTIWSGTMEYQNMKQQTVDIMEQLIQSGSHTQLHEIFQDDSNRKYIHLKEYEAIADADYLEMRAGSKKRLWQDGMDVLEVKQHIRTLKYWIKRIEHRTADTAFMMDRILQEYSVYAVAVIFVKYVEEKTDMSETIRNYFEQNHCMQELEVWQRVAAGV